MTKTMRIAICKRPGHIEVERRPIPSVGDNEVLVKISVCGICGSDLAAWRGSGHKKYPYTPGHEFCGVIERLGSEVTGLQVGERVVINPNLGCGECRFCRMGKANLCDALKTRPTKSNGGFSEYVSLDWRMVYRLPESFPDKLAPFIEPLSCAVYAVRVADVKPAEQVAIFGAGIMGILTGLAIKSAECEIIFIEPMEERREQVAELFETSAMTPEQLRDCEPVGKIDAAIEYSGSVEAVSQAIRTLRKGGRLVLGGLVVNAEEVGLPLIDVTMKELEIKGVWLNPGTFKEAIELAVEHKNVLGALKTETFRLDDIASAFERALSKDVNKVLVRP